MSHLLAAEWLKLRYRWMPRVIVLIMLLIMALIMWGISTSNQRPNVLLPRSLILALFFASAFAPFLWPVLGGSWAGNEYGWGTVRLILSRRPNRVQWIAAALLILVAVAFLALIASLVVGAIAGLIVKGLTGEATGSLQDPYAWIVVKSFLGAWYVLIFYLVLAYSLGTIFRSGAVGIGLGIGITVAELIVFGIFNGLGGTWRDIADHFPYAYTQALPNRLVREGTTSSFADIPSHSPSAVASVIGIAIYLAILLGATMLVVTRRDVTS